MTVSLELRSPWAPNRLWRSAQIAALVATAALLVGLVWSPGSSLLILWTFLIPLVPLTLLLSPLIWRNVCPLATVNMLASARRRGGPGRLGRKHARLFTTGGILLLVLLVPARRFLFNTDGMALAVTIAIVAAAAVLLGARHDMKAGFCNAICPILPVERLYGQSPVLQVSNQRCWTCTACSPACIDVSPRMALSQQMGSAASSVDWVGTPFGLFAAAFPGFIYGYFTLADGALGAAGGVYLHVMTWAVVSALAVIAVSLLLNLYAAQVFPAIAAVAAAIYYWFTLPSVAATAGLNPAIARTSQAIAVLLIVTWWVKAAGLKKSASALVRDPPFPT